MAFSNRFGQVGMTLLPRVDGGWLAVSAPGSVLRIGVAGSSEKEASEKFERALDRWTALWDEQSVSRETGENMP
jgi:hypothetical protein